MKICSIYLWVLVSAMIFILFSLYVNKHKTTKKEGFDSWSEGELRCLSHGGRCKNVGWRN